MPVQLLDKSVIIVPELKKDHGGDLPPLDDHEGPRPSSCDWQHTVCTETPTYRILWAYGGDPDIYCGRHYALTLTSFVMNHENEMLCDVPPFMHIHQYGKIGEEKVAAEFSPVDMDVSDDDHDYYGEKFWRDYNTGVVKFIYKFNASEDPDEPLLIYCHGAFTYRKILRTIKKKLDYLDFFSELTERGKYVEPDDEDYEKWAQKFENTEADLKSMDPWVVIKLHAWAGEYADLN